MDELQRLDRARLLVKPPRQPIIQHKVSTWINGVEYTVHMVEETCYKPNRCRCQRGSFIGSSEEISSNNESEIGTPLLIRYVMPLETEPLSEDIFPNTEGGKQL